MEKGQKCQLLIDDMSNEGQGIGRVDGMAVFVKGAVPGDTVIAEITKVKKNYAFAVAAEIVEASPFRIEAECSYANQCGGCTYSGVSYEGQLQIKAKAQPHSGNGQALRLPKQGTDAHQHRRYYNQKRWNYREFGRVCHRLL